MATTWTRALHELPLQELLEALAHPDDVASLVREGFELSDLARPGIPSGSVLPELRPQTRRRLEAAFELARRRARASLPERPRIVSTEDVLRIVAPELRDEPIEVFRVLLLDARNRCLASVEVARGILNSSLVHPREVYRPALLAGANAVIVAHNHPSGDPEPSTEDDGVTRRLAGTGALVGIPLLDHVVIGDGVHVSYRGRGSRLLDAEWA